MTTLTLTLLMVSGPALPPTQLSASDKAGLAWMREEEKLARDVYQKLAEKWGRPFSNITQSEQNHMDAIGGLLSGYGVPDPSANMAPGKFKIRGSPDFTTS